MTDTPVTEAPIEAPKRKRLGMSSDAGINIYNHKNGNPWSADDIDKMDSLSEKGYKKTVEACRFFYTHDALSATVINKLVEIAINKVVFNRNGLSINEFRVFTAIEQKLKEFAEDMALEYLISGLVVPEYKVAAVTKEELKDLGIKKYDTLQLPVSMWLRDPSTITINKTFASAEPSYFVEIDEATLYFILHGGKYSDGTSDTKLFEQLKANFPEFVSQVIAGQRKFLLENDNILRRKVLSNSPYPIPYLYPAIEPLKHKRNLRRMDYSIAARVISAILLVRLGSDEFPVTEDDQDQFEAIKQQLLYRNTFDKDVERIAMLFGNHTLQLEWVSPDTNALLNDAKYMDVNQDIIFALGFPRILITGETEKSNAGDAQYATMSPVQTMNNLRERILSVLKNIVEDIASKNRFTSTPKITFKPLQLSEFAVFSNILIQLYDRGTLSKETLDEYFGFDFSDELEKRVTEQKEIIDAKIPEFPTPPNGGTPENGGRGTPGQDKPATTTGKQPGRPTGTVNTD
jgi:hypothetical protein